MSRTRAHINLNEQLLFEIGSPGRRAYDLPPLDIPLRPLAEIVPLNCCASASKACRN